MARNLVNKRVLTKIVQHKNEEKIAFKRKYSSSQESGDRSQNQNSCDSRSLSFLDVLTVMAVAIR